MADFKELREKAYEANMELPKQGLVVLTWGNASEIDRERGVFAIKPSGVSYDHLQPEDIVICDLEGEVVDGSLRPSSDTKTHACLYRAWGDIGGIVHTHSAKAVAWAQAGRSIPCYGTTHADNFYGSLPCMRGLSAEEAASEYEVNTGKVIVEGFSQLDHLALPGCLVRNHGPFSWGTDAIQAVKTAVVIEQVASMALDTEQLLSQAGLPLESGLASQSLLDTHYQRKHGPHAYYGQVGD